MTMFLYHYEILESYVYLRIDQGQNIPNLKSI